MSSIRKIYTDDRTKLCELKKANTKIEYSIRLLLSISLQ